MTSVYDAEPIPAEARAAVERMLASGDLFRYTAPADQPTEVTRLEGEFAEAMGARYALALNSCSSAIFLSLRALEVPRDGRVLIPAFTFAAVPSAIVHAGAVPVLVECGPDYRLDMVDFEGKLDDSIAAVVVSHMRGHTSDMDAIVALCDARGVPVIEDAAHSLGTLWDGRRIGTIGRIGCFSFQSYKLVNGGEGGMLITDDADLIARLVIMSGAYEHNWQKHALGNLPFARHQNQLPLYNMRMTNLSAAVIRPQIPLIPERVKAGRRNHDLVAQRLNASAHLAVPAPLPPEERAPDSIQFNLVGFDDAEVGAFTAACADHGVSVSVFGAQRDNARAFWNWGFLGQPPDLPRTRAMLSRACDARLPARLTPQDCDCVADAILAAVGAVKG